MASGDVCPIYQCQCYHDGKSEVTQIALIMILVASLSFFLGWWASKKTSAKHIKIVSTQSQCTYALHHQQPRFRVLPDRDQGAWHQ